MPRNVGVMVNFSCHMENWKQDREREQVQEIYIYRVWVTEIVMHLKENLMHLPHALITFDA